MKLHRGLRDIDTGRPYPLRMILRVAERSSAAYYESTKRKAAGVACKKRGPSPSISDEVLLSRIEEVIAAYPFHATGYKKICARVNRTLRANGISVGKNRVFRLMKGKDLLHKAPGGSGSSRVHDGKIIQDAPKVMWGTDGKKFWTEEDGWCWLFDVADHFNSEIVGWNAVKTGDRFEAARAVQNAVAARYGTLQKGVAKGLALRNDRGTQYTSDAFGKSMEYLGITISFAWARSPECNGIIERFHRTIQEQLFAVRHFKNLHEACQEIGVFIDRYNKLWMIERLAYRSPLEARSDYEAQQARKVA